MFEGLSSIVDFVDWFGPGLESLVSWLSGSFLFFFFYLLAYCIRLVYLVTLFFVFS